MRIIAGRFKGRRLPPAPPGLRPSTDRVRERLFMVLGPVLAGGLAVDLFCGLGTLGLEALSRGAERCLFVDRSARSLASIRRCAEHWGLAAEAYQLRRADALRFVEQDWPAEPVAWIFLDPPYGDPVGERCLAALGRLASAGIGRVAFEGPGPVAAPEGLDFERSLDFGDTRITLLRGGLGT